jgi:hypothetical protein
MLVVGDCYIDSDAQENEKPPNVGPDPWYIAS